MATLIDAPPGLEGVVVADTTVGDVRGHEGFFHYRGYSAPALARTHSLEAVWHLVQRGHLPTEAELQPFSEEAARWRRLDPALLDVLPGIATQGTPMSAVRTALSLAGQNARPWLDLPPEARGREAMRLTALMPSLVAAVWRARNGQAPVPSQGGLDVAADYFQMVTGAAPSAAANRALERYLILTIDHGFNASTFATRVVTSTGADLTSAAVAGIAALSGPLHGGAPSRVVDMLTEIGTPERARAWVERALAAGQRIMGFGHRVYRTEDPRSALLKETAIELGGPIVELALEVERVALEILDQKYPERRLRTNVEFYAGVVLHEIGLPAELFPPTFAVSRMIGWMAHALEQMTGNRILRPASRYVGAMHA
jgi:citrate synthase